MRPWWCVHGFCMPYAVIQSAFSPAQLAPPQALTASCSDDERERCRAAGLVGLLPKPIKLSSLQGLLQEHVGSAAAGTEQQLPQAG